MEPYPLYYSRRQRSEEPVEPNVRMMYEEMQRMGVRLEGMEVHLGEKIEGRCIGLEQRVIEGEQRAEERIISLKMARTEAEASRAALEKQFDDLRLEVHHVNRFMER
jgi:hypothetical protein